MKRFALILFVTQVVLAGCDSFRNEIVELHREIDNLKAQVGEINTNIESLNSMISAVQNEDYVKSVIPVILDGDTIGYTINFSKSGSVTIYNGKDGRDGYTPMLGVKKDGDLWYWTIDGIWLIDDSGQKVVANGRDGKDGKNGEDTSTPQLKIEDDYWYISYDEGKSWIRLGKSTGSNGKDGENGKDGDSFFASVDTSNPEYITITLTNGTVFKFPTWAAFESLQLMVNSINTNVSALQSIVEVLESQDWVTGVTPLIEDRLVVGYTISFAKADPIVIYNGKDGRDGKDAQDGATPQIGVRQDSDENWYWTLNGEWLLDSFGNRVRANGNPGRDGSDGEDGITPRLQITDGYWQISYDEGATWVTLGKATGENGKDGKDGSDGGNSIISSVTQDELYVYFILSDGTIITIPKSETTLDVIQFKDYKVKMICVSHWDSDGDCELSKSEAAQVKTIGTVFSSLTDAFLFEELRYFTGLTTIENNAFKNSAFIKVCIPENVEMVGAYAFYGCTGLKSVSFESSSNCVEFKEQAFAKCSNLLNINIPSSVAYIDSNCFEGCFSLEAITIPKAAILVGDKAFYNCSSLKYLSFEKPSRLQSISEQCFKGTAICSLEVPNSVITIKDGAFMGCPIESLTFEQTSKLTTICGSFDSYQQSGTREQHNNETTYSGAFADCDEITSIVFPASVSSIQSAAFKRCDKLRLIEFEAGSKLSTIGGGTTVWVFTEITGGRALVNQGAFSYCQGLEEAILPPSLQSLPVGAFGCCSSLKKVVIQYPSQLTHISDQDYSYTSQYSSDATHTYAGAFGSCPSIEEIHIGKTTPPSCGSNAFSVKKSNVVLYVPIGSLSAYQSHSFWKAFTNIKER